MFVSAPGAPLRFAVPPGWPSPTAEWVVEHQATTFHPKWTPLPGVPPAPVGWKFWVKNQPEWDELVRPAFAAFRRRLWACAVIFTAGIGMTIFAAATGAPPGFYIVCLGALIYGPVEGVSVLTRWSKARVAANEFLSLAAAELRHQANIDAYQQYLQDLRNQS